MMERLNSFKQNVQSLNARLTSSGGAQIQKIYSTVYGLCLVLRFPGESTRLWIGRGGPVEGVLFPGPECPAIHRIKDRFLELERKMLKGFKMLDARYIENGHFIIHARSRDIDVWSLYTWSSGKLYFSIIEKKAQSLRVLSPWINQRWKDIEGGVESVIQLHQHELEPDVRNPIHEKNIAPSEVQLRKVINKKKKFLKRKNTNIKKDLEKVLLADELQEWAMMLREEELLGGSIEFKGLKIKLSFADSFYQKRDLIFKKAKAYRSAQPLLKRRLEETEKELALLSEDATKYEQVELDSRSRPKPVSPAWARGNEISKKAESGSVFEGSTTYDGQNVRLAIGQNAHANDSLRAKWAKKNDYWFHLDGQISAHGFVKMINDVPLTMELFEVVASGLKEHSKTESDEIDLIYTRVKYLKSIKGKPGLVKYTNEKRVRVGYRPDWKEILANL